MDAESAIKFNRFRFTSHRANDLLAAVEQNQCGRRAVTFYRRTKVGGIGIVILIARTKSLAGRFVSYVLPFAGQFKT